MVLASLSSTLGSWQPTDNHDDCFGEIDDKDDEEIDGNEEETDNDYLFL